MTTPRRFLHALLAVAALLATGCDRIESAYRDATSKVPSKLFDIRLGGLYTVTGSDFSQTDLPIAKFAAAQQALGIGVFVYFQPAKPYSAFPYEEHRNTAQDKFFLTTYDVYLLPVIPPGLKSIKELENASSTKFEVAKIEWATFRGVAASDEKKNEDYAWAKTMCGTFQADLGITPKVLDQFVLPGDKSTALGSFYTCTFADGARELEVGSALGRTVKLSFSKDTLNKKTAAIEQAVQKLQAPAVRPY